MTFSLGSTPRSLVKYNDQSISAITEIGSGAKDSMVLIKTITASADATLTFDSGIDSTYPIYLFKFINIHPATDSVHLSFNGRDGGSAYDATKTSSFFNILLYENDTGASLAYNTAGDLQQDTGVQSISRGIGADNDQSASGELWLFNPSSTTFVKHFMSRDSTQHGGDGSFANFVGGYFNVTAAIDGIQFSMSSGNIDAGTIKLYGLKDSA